MDQFKYSGTELELFASARNWKGYWSQQVMPFLRGNVLEVGAGIGSNTSILDAHGGGQWTCLEPDPHLFSQLVQTLKKIPSRRAYEPICGTLQALKDQQFDTILYVDVLEHIKDDREELNQAALHLRSRGHIIVLSPAHQRLFTPFDAAIGHFRRYDRSALRHISPSGLNLISLKYLDSIGLIASTANLLLLRQSMPTIGQIGLWDRWMVPASRVLDPCFRYHIGKSILAVWAKA